MHPRVLVVLAVLATGFAFPCNAHAQSFPTKSIRLIVPFPPGSQPDTLALCGAAGDPRKARTEPMPQSAEAFAAFIAAETRKWADIIRLSGTKPN
jgi:hypothetical protein